MKKIRLIIVLPILIIIFLFACETNMENEENSEKKDSPPSPLKMISVSVPSGGGDGITFPMGSDDASTATISQPFSLGETEMTNEELIKILQWAYNNGKLSDNISDQNGINSEKIKYGEQSLIDLTSYCKINFSSGLFSIDSGYEKHPVVNITWFGAVMACNWLTEKNDGNTNNVVYKWIDNGDGSGTASDGIWQYDETDIDTSKKGYRLPSEEEFEFAARWYGSNSEGRTDLVSQNINGGDASLDTGYYWTPGLYASGATTSTRDTSDLNNNGIPDGKEANDKVAVYGNYWDGDSWESTGVTGPAEAASKGNSGRNKFGLYDMSGNVFEWTNSDGLSDKRVIKSGSWFHNCNIEICVQYSVSPDYIDWDCGFRLCRTM